MFIAVSRTQIFWNPKVNYQTTSRLDSLTASYLSQSLSHSASEWDTEWSAGRGSCTTTEAHAPRPLQFPPVRARAHRHWRTCADTSRRPAPLRLLCREIATIYVHARPRTHSTSQGSPCVFVLLDKYVMNSRGNDNKRNHIGHADRSNGCRSYMTSRHFDIALSTYHDTYRPRQVLLSTGTLAPPE